MLVINDEPLLLRGKIYTTPLELAGKLNVGKIPPKTQTKTVNPTTSVQEVIPDTGYTGLSKVTVTAVTSDIDADIIPSNIKQGVDILGVIGTYEQGYFVEYENNTLVFDDSDRPVSVQESELILSDN